MRKSIIAKRTKKTTKTYMREAIDYELIILKERPDLFVTIKKFNKVTEKFCLKNQEGQEVTYIDNGYYMVELTPLNENYNIRYYVDNNKKIISYYIDVTLFNGEEDKTPYYVDLYLDVLHHKKDGSLYFVDEDELKDALDKKIISKKDYNLAYKVGNRLIEQLKNKENEYMKIDVLKYIDRYFK